MIATLLGLEGPRALLVGTLFCGVLTFVLLAGGMKVLPRDGGREFAHDGALSAGKPRGAGLLFVLAFLLSALCFLPFSVETLIYLLLTGAAMLTGFLDDAAKHPWGELKKGLLDLVLAGLAAVTYVNFQGSAFWCFGNQVALPPVVFGILAAALIWGSINVTNCSEGVDGLCGTLSVSSLLTIYSVGLVTGVGGEFTPASVLLIGAILAYLWFNATPSRLLMGDAGSRAIGFFLAVAILKTGRPLLYLPAALVLLVDGGSSLFKVSVIRFLKIKIMTNIRTPLHDHVRKNKDWSNTQVVFRFAILQALASFVTLCLVK